MNKVGGFIVLHRKILDWEWFKDVNTFRLFVYLLLTANYENSRFMGKTIKRGQVVTSLPALATGTKLSIRQVRTALEHLKSTGEVTDKATNQYRVITITKYDDYQNVTGNLTGKRQANDRQLDRQTTDKTTPIEQYKQYKQNNKGTNNKREGAFAPPTLAEVESYVREKGYRMDASAFFDHFSASGWVMKGGQKIKDWKAAVRNWERREKDGFGRTGEQQQGTKRVDYTWLPD